VFTERTRNDLPNLIDQDDPTIKYINSFFVDTRFVNADEAKLFPSPSKSKPYMEQVGNAKIGHSMCSHDTLEQRTHRHSRTESFASTTENSKLPENLRYQFEKLDIIGKT